MGGESVLLLWVVKVCHYMRVVKISGEKMNGGQVKFDGLFPGGKKVAAVWRRCQGGKGRVVSAYARLGPPNPDLDIYFLTRFAKHPIVCNLRGRPGLPLFLLSSNLQVTN